MILDPQGLPFKNRLAMRYRYCINEIALLKQKYFPLKNRALSKGVLANVRNAFPDRGFKP